MNPLLKSLQEKAEALRASMDEILTRAASESRDDLTEAETSNFEDAERQVKDLDERIAHLSNLELERAAAADLAAKVAEATGKTGAEAPAHVKSEQRTYSEATPERSYFADVFAAQVRNDPEAHARLNRHYQENLVERSGTVANLGEFAPPAYLVNDYMPLARSARPVANAIGSRPHPNSKLWTIPKVTQGTALGVQAAELDPLATQDMEADDVTVTSVTLNNVFNGKVCNLLLCCSDKLLDHR
jgi:HK97 family phage major capsid protein